MTTYFVDFTGGSDSNDGLSTGAPFKTWNKARTTAGANDTVRFKCGESWTGISDTWVMAEGQTINAYDTGADPIFTTSSNVYYFSAASGQTNLTWADLHLKDGQGPCFEFRDQTSGTISQTNVNCDNNLQAIPAGGDAGFDDRSIRIDNCHPDSHLMDNVDITQNSGDDCLTAVGWSNFTIRNCDWTLVDGADVIQIVGNGTKNGHIHDSTFARATSGSDKGIGLFGSFDYPLTGIVVEDVTFDGGNLDIFFGVTMNFANSIFRRFTIKDIGGGNSAAAINIVGPNNKNSNTDAMTITDFHISNVHYGILMGINPGAANTNLDVTVRIMDGTFDGVDTWFRRYSSGDGNYHGVITRCIVRNATNTSQSLQAGDTLEFRNNYYFNVAGETDTGSDPAPDANGIPTHSDAYGYGPKPATGGTPTLDHVERGTGQMSDTATTHDIILTTPLTATAQGPHRTIVEVLTRCSTGDPQQYNIAFELIDNQTLRLHRHASGSVVDFAYRVAEYTAGVVVERHYHRFNRSASETVSMAFSAIGDVFTFNSYRSFGTAFGAQEHARVELSANGSNGLQQALFAINAGTNDGHRQMAQLIHYASCTVQRGTATMASADALTSIAITSVDLTKSFAQITYTHDEATTANSIAEMMLRALFNGPDQLDIHRGSTGATHAISWEVPTFTDSVIVRSFSLTMAALATTDSATIGGVADATTLLLTSSNLIEGSTTYTDDDVAGVARVTLGLTGTTQVDGERNTSDGDATWNGFAIDLAGAQTVTVGLATETDTAFSVSTGQTLNLSQAIETDSAFAVTLLKTAILALASETDSAFAITGEKTGVVGLATETDSAFATTYARAAVMAIASEADTAFAVTYAKAANLGLASETNSAFAVAVLNIAALFVDTGYSTATILNKGKT